MRVHAFWCCAVLLLAACGGDEVEESASPPLAEETEPVVVAPEPEVVRPELECEAKNFACTWDEVSPAVAERGAIVAQDILEVLAQGGSPEDAAVAVFDVEGMAEVVFGESAVRFRLEGGRPEWVMAETAANQIGTPPVLPSSVKWAKRATRDPVGEQKDKPTKSALLLSPFDWHWALGNESDAVDSLQILLEATRDFGQGSVDVRKNSIDGLQGGTASLSGFSGGSGSQVGGTGGQNQQAQLVQGVSWADFVGWDAYDVIHVSTHGGTVCKLLLQTTPMRVEDLNPCQTNLSTGNLWDGLTPAVADGLAFTTTVGLARVWVPGTSTEAPAVRMLFGDSSVGPSKRNPGQLNFGPFTAVSTDFFKAYYPGGLSESLVFLSACQSGKQSDLVNHLSLGGSTVVGWSESMALKKATASAVCFWRAMLGHGDSGVPDDLCTAAIDVVVKRQGQGKYTGGATVEDAFDVIGLFDSSSPVPVMSSGGQLIKSSGSANDPTGGVTGAVAGAQMFPAGDELNRAIEIVRLVEQGTDLEFQDADFLTLTGNAGDGVPDTIVAEIEVFGLGPDDDPDAMTLHVDVDGATQSADLLLPQRPLPWTARTPALIPLDVDLTPGETIDLEVWAEYPDGTSRWRYEDLSYECYARDRGDMAATFSTPFARTLPRGQENNAVRLDPNPSIPGVPSGWVLRMTNRKTGDFEFGVRLDDEPLTGSVVTIDDAGFSDFRFSGGIDFDTEDATAWQSGSLTIRFAKVTADAACGTLTAELGGTQAGRMAPRFVNTTLTARFWAEIRR